MSPYKKRNFGFFVDEFQQSKIQLPSNDTSRTRQRVSNALSCPIIQVDPNVSPHLVFSRTCRSQSAAKMGGKMHSLVTEFGWAAQRAFGASFVSRKIEERKRRATASVRSSCSCQETSQASFFGMANEIGSPPTKNAIQVSHRAGPGADVGASGVRSEL